MNDKRHLQQTIISNHGTKDENQNEATASFLLRIIFTVCDKLNFLASSIFDNELRGRIDKVILYSSS